MYFFFFFAFFFLRIWGLNFGLPYDGLHPTEHFSISHAIHYLTAAGPKPLNFQHPSLFQYLLTIFSRILSIPSSHYSYIYLLARAISCLSSFLSVWFIYLLSKTTLNSKNSSLLCATFLGFNLLSIKYSHYATPDSLCLVFICLSMLFSLKIMEQPDLKNYLSCGLFCGLSIASKFSGLLSLGFLFFSQKRHRHHRLALSLLIAFLTFFAVSPYHIFYLKEALIDFHKYFLEKGYLTSTSFKSSGFFTYPFILLPDTFGLFGLLSALIGLFIMFLKERRKACVIFIPLLIYFFIIGKEKGGTIQNILPLLPGLCILAAYFFLKIKVRESWRLFLIALCLLPQLTKALIFDFFLLKKDTRILAQEWLMKNAREKSRIGFECYTPFDLNYLGRSLVKERFNATYFIPSLSLYPATFYKQAGYDYIVTSNFREDNFIFFCKTEGRCGNRDNYSSYDTQLKLVAVFKPSRIFKLSSISLPWGTWPHNPVIKIYKVNPEEY